MATSEIISNYLSAIKIISLDFLVSQIVWKVTYSAFLLTETINALFETILHSPTLE